MGKGKLFIALVVVLVLIVVYQIKDFSTQKMDNAALSVLDGDSENYPSFEPFWGIVDIGQETDLSGYNGKDGNALDGLSFGELSNLRMTQVGANDVLELYPPDYHPFEDYHNKIYGQIEEFQNWLNPAAYFFTNPYLLIIPTHAPYINPLNLACPDVSIVYDAGVIEEVHTGASASCWFDTLYQPHGQHGTLWLFMVNAWDAGFKYAHVDVEQSKNVLASSEPDHITNSVHSRSYFYHVGQYGVNNISPRDTRAWVTLRQRDTPTEIYVKLWQKKPKTLTDEADIVYVVKVFSG